MCDGKVGSSEKIAAKIGMDSSELCKYANTHSYEFVKMIGQGGFASVALVVSLKYQKQFAMKVSHGIAKQSDLLEIVSLMKLNHPNIIRIYEYFQEEGHLCMILEYCPGGSLKQMLKADHVIETSKLLNILEQIADALSFCHSNNIAHRDIKPDNILIDSYGRPVLSDFGLAQHFEQGVKTQTFAGSRPFMAPETFERGSFYDPFPADIWSLGILMYMMMYGELPWNGLQIKNLDLIIEMGVLIYPPHPLLDIMKTMLAVNPKERPLIGDVLKKIQVKKILYPPLKKRAMIPKLIPLISIPHCHPHAISTFSLNYKGNSKWKTKGFSRIPFFVQAGTSTV